MDWKRFLSLNPGYNVIRKIVALSLAVAFYTYGYLYLNYTTINSEKFYDVSFTFEKEIPFFPELVWSYIFVYFLVIIMFLVINDDRLLTQAIKAFITITIIHFVFFYYMPVKMVDRPALTPNGDFWNDYAAFWFWLDNPTTLFPSAHVSMSFLSAYVTARVHKKLGVFCLLMAAYVGVSVVLVKQHYIADVIAGMGLASLAYYVFIADRSQRDWQRIKEALGKFKEGDKNDGRLSPRGSRS